MVQISTIFVFFYFAILLIPSIFGIHRYYLVYLYRKNREKRPLVLPFELLSRVPKVTVQLPIYNERYVANRLIRAVCDFDYPIDKIEIQVLDDSNDETVSIVAREVELYREKGYQIEHVRRGSREGFKAGALNEGLRRASGEYVAVFDADFLPQADFLKKVIPHFYRESPLREDPAQRSSPISGLPVRAGREGVRGMPGGIPRYNVGMVQTRWEHLNRDYSLLTRAQAILLDGHFIIEHTARHRSGCFFNFNGTAGVWRKECIETSGAWSGDTLTEDIDLSYRAQMAGWDFVYLDDVVAPAELPVDMNALKTQQHRWAKGSVQVARKLLPGILKGPYPLRVKIEAFFHLAANFNYLLIALISLLMPISIYVRRQQGWYDLLWIDLPFFLSATWSVSVFYYHSQKAVYPDRLQRIKYILFSLAVGIGLSINNSRAVLEGLFNKPSEFKRTPKYAVVSRGDSWKEKTYRGKLNFTSLVEVFLAISFAVVLVYTIYEQLYLSIPFVLIFEAGYLYTSILSIMQSRGIGTAEVIAPPQIAVPFP